MSSLGLRALPTSKSDMASLALEGKALSSYSFFFKNSSCHILQSKDSDWPHATCHSIPGATLCRISSVEGNRKICGKKLRISSQKSRQVVVHAEGKGSAGGDSENVEQSGKATVEKGQKILSMQQELLDQISERKKLIASLKDNIEKSAGQVRGYRGYNAPKKDTVGRSGEQMRADNDLLMKNGNGKPAEEASANGSYDALATSGSKSSTSRASSQSKVSSKETIDGIKVGQAGLGTPTKSGGGSPSLPPFESSTTPIATPKPTPKPALKPSSPLPNSSVVAPSAPRLVPRGLEKKPTETEKEKPPKAPVLEALKDASTAEVVEKSPPPVSANAMNIILVAAECAPWSKTGGLGDVAGALPKALARCGHRVMVVSPRYAEYREAIDMGVQNRYKVDGQDFEVRYYHVYIDGVDYVFLGSSMFIHLGNDIYRGSREDVLKRMVLLCKAAVEVPWHVPCGGICYGDGNLVFIANDWHTALLPVYLQAYYRDQGLMKFTRSVLIIHNIAHQGRGPMTDFRLLGLPEHYKDKFRLYDPVGGEHMNVFMAGLMRAHRIVAVSHGYAWECQTMDGGWGLHGIIQENAWKLRGIVNGIDNKDWNPELDIFLQSDGYENYTLESLETGKAACKAALQKELRLPVRSDVPLIGFIGRLDYQKGVDIIAEAMPWLMEQDLQLVMLGSGRQDLEVMLRSFEGQYRDKARGWVGFSVQTAHRITAGVDILLMPSRFEPCGLNQLYSMKYGTIPVVHAVGGLKDTVQGFDPFNNTGTGWTFEKANSAAMIHALGNALWTYRDFKESWVGIQKRGMTQDLSWDKAAKQYEEVLLAAKFQW